MSFGRIKNHTASADPGLIACFRIAVTLMGLLLLCGCSSFNRAWREAGRTSRPYNGIEGRWEGHWLSEVNGHNGALRCIVTTTNGVEFDARFRATYLKVLKFSYTVPLKAWESNGVWHFEGEEDLGSMAGGLYQYEGKATPTEFHSTYTSEHDHGVFEMQRPAQDD